MVIWIVASGGDHEVCGNSRRENIALLTVYRLPLLGLTTSNFAFYTTSQGKYDEAELFCRHRLDMEEKASNSDHSAVASTLSNLANISCLQVEVGNNFLKKVVLIFLRWGLFRRYIDVKTVAFGRRLCAIAVGGVARI